MRGVGEMDINQPVPPVQTVSESNPFLMLDVRDLDDYEMCHIISGQYVTMVSVINCYRQCLETNSAWPSPTCYSNFVLAYSYPKANLSRANHFETKEMMRYVSFAQLRSEQLRENLMFNYQEFVFDLSWSVALTELFLEEQAWMYCNHIWWVREYCTGSRHHTCSTRIRQYVHAIRGWVFNNS